MRSMGYIRRAVGRTFGIQPDSLSRECRERIYVDAREVFCYIACKEGYTTEEVADHLKRHRTTVLHALNKASADMEYNRDFVKQVEKTYKTLENGLT